LILKIKPNSDEAGYGKSRVKTIAGFADFFPDFTGPGLDGVSNSGI